MENFKSLQHLSHLVPARNSPHPVQKSSVVPMKILFCDEKYTAEIVEIVSQLLDDVKLSGDNPQAGRNIICMHTDNAYMYTHRHPYSTIIHKHTYIKPNTSVAM